MIIQFQHWIFISVGTTPFRFVKVVNWKNFNFIFNQGVQISEFLKKFKQFLNQWLWYTIKIFLICLFKKSATCKKYKFTEQVNPCEHFFYHSTINSGQLIPECCAKTWIYEKTSQNDRDFSLVCRKVKYIYSWHLLMRQDESNFIFVYRNYTCACKLKKTN